MQFVKSIGNIIGWFKSVKASDEEEYVCDSSSENDSSEDYSSDDDTNAPTDTPIISKTSEEKTVFTRSQLNDEKPTKMVLNCSCRGEDPGCTNFHSRCTYPMVSILNNKWLADTNINDTFSSQSVEERLKKIYTNKYADGFIVCLKNLGYYNVNTYYEQLASQFYQLSNVIDFNDVLTSDTLKELFQKYDIEPCFENINKKITRSFQLSKYIGSDDWAGFVNELTEEETKELLDYFEEY